MNLSIEPCLWIDASRAREAVDFYIDSIPDSHLDKADTFENSGPEGEEPVYVFELALAKRRVQILGAGPHQQLNPAISMKFVSPERETAERVGQTLLDGGVELMPFAAYPWSSYFGWVVDRYGISWQVLVEPDHGPLLAPAMMFVGAQNGRAQEAIDLYTSLFPNSSIELVQHFGADDPDQEGNIFYATIELAGQRFDLTENGADHDFAFNDMISLAVMCDGQKEVDRYWDGLLANGGEPSQCGWLKDRFGVSWQIIPRQLNELLNSTEPGKAEAAMRCILQQVKIDIAELEAACQTAKSNTTSAG